MTLVHPITFVALMCALIAIEAEELPHPLSDEFIDLINSKQTSWKAGRNFPLHTSMDYIKRFMGLMKEDSRPPLEYREYDQDLIESLPDNFDPTVKWPNCPSLNEIRDQGDCGSGWALAAVEAMTDRYCIFSNGTKRFHFSAEDVLSCSEGSCKDGGTLLSSWEYWQTDGIVSGGAYNSNEGCKPYTIEPCEHHVNGTRKPCNDSDTPTPKCVHSCRADYSVDYEKDKRRGKNMQTVGREDTIKAELYKNGPIEVGLDVYADFLNYKSGVYKNVEGDCIGEHAVKMLGWGVENGTKYWLCANSWNTDWGDKGFFKILRGEDHCGIEFGVAGEPIIV